MPFVKGALPSKIGIHVKLVVVIKNNDAAIMQCRSDEVERETGNIIPQIFVTHQAVCVIC